MYCSVLGTKKSDSGKLPLHGCCHSSIWIGWCTLNLGLQEASEDQVSIISLWIDVNWALVGSLLQVSKVLLGLVGLTWLVTGGNGNCTDVKNWELVIELLRLGVLEIFSSLVPSGTLKEESMDKHTLTWYVQLLALDSSIISVDYILLSIRCVLDLIKRPVLGLLLSCNFLLHGSKETLWVEETGHPE